MNLKVMVFLGVFLIFLNLAAWQKDGVPIATKPGGQTNHRPVIQEDKYSFYDVCFPANSDSGFVVGSKGMVLSTVDGGITWKKEEVPTTVDLHDAEFLSSKTGLVGYVVGDSSTVLKYIPGAWTTLTLPVPRNTQLYSVSFPVGDSTGYIAGKNDYFSPILVIKTTNGGSNWFDCSPPDSIYFGFAFPPYLVRFPVDNDTGFLMAYMPDNGIVLRTFDGGKTWMNPRVQQFMHKIYFERCICAVSFPTNNHIGYAVGYSYDSNPELPFPDSSALTYRTVDGTDWAKGWSFSKVFFYGVCFPVDIQIGYVVGSSGKIYKTADSGNTWIKLNSGTTNDLYAVSFTNNIDTGYVVGANGTMLKTTDGGNSWQKLGIEERSHEKSENPIGLRISPNPFSKTVTIKFSIPSTGKVSLKVYNESGQLVQTIIDRILTPGSYNCLWGSQDTPSGVYFYVLTHNQMCAGVKKIIKTKGAR